MDWVFAQYERYMRDQLKEEARRMFPDKTNGTVKSTVKRDLTFTDIMQLGAQISRQIDATVRAMREDNLHIDKRDVLAAIDLVHSAIERNGV